MEPTPDEPPDSPRAHVGFVRPPPAPPLTAQQLRFEPLVTISGWLMFVGLLLTFSGCGVAFLLWWLGPYGLAGAATGAGIFAVAVVLRYVARWLQNRPS